MVNPRRSVRSPSLSRRSLLFLVTVFVAYQAICQYKIIFHNSKILDHEDTEFENASVVFKLHSKYPTLPPTDRPSRQLQILLERDLKRLGSKAATIFSKRAALDAVTKPSVIFPVGGSVQPDGLYFAEVHLGNPPKPYYLVIDTGSDLTWLQCDAPCITCGRGPHALYTVASAETMDCRDPLCLSIQQGVQYECIEDMNGIWTQCNYEVQYADGSFTLGALVLDAITLTLSDGKTRRTKAAIGCGYHQSGHLAQNPSATDGVIGLSNSKGSLPSQFAQKRIANKVIGICLGKNTGNLLFLGEALVPTVGMTWVPNAGTYDKFGTYQANLAGLWYGNNQVQAPGALQAEMTFDSGATFTYLVPVLYNAILSAVIAETIKWNFVRNRLDMTLPYCWNYPHPANSLLHDMDLYFKIITLHFGGQNILELRPSNYLIHSRIGNVCLGILNASDISHVGFSNILGDISMQGFLIVYNNRQNQLGWMPKDCRNWHIQP